MEHRMGFVEFVWLPSFTRSSRPPLGFDDQRELELSLTEDPERGALLEGTGGFRSVEVPGEGMGEGHDVHVVYFYVPHRERIYLLLAHRESAGHGLTAPERAELRRLSAIIERGTD